MGLFDWGKKKVPTTSRFSRVPAPTNPALERVRHEKAAAEALVRQQTREQLIDAAREDILKRTVIGGEYRGGAIVRSRRSEYVPATDALKELVEEGVFQPTISKKRRLLYKRVA